ncbi:MerR family transcriptional regulator [Priestia megaterium]
MEGLQGNLEALYSPGEVASQLNVQRQIVTKYARIFETKSFVFHKDEKGNRTYTDTNISMFKRVINSKNKLGITLETVIKGVIPIYMRDCITPCVTEIFTEK